MKNVKLFFYMLGSMREAPGSPAVHGTPRRSEEAKVRPGERRAALS